MTINLKRIYEKPTKNDGMRVLVDRLWPRGITKQKAKLDDWQKEIAPSDEIRRWFAHDPRKWNDFKKMYLEELKMKKDLVKIFWIKIKDKKTTFLYSARDAKYNNAIILKEFLEKEYKK